MKKPPPPEIRRLRKFHALGKKVLQVYETSEPLASGSRRRGVAREFDSRLGLKRDQIDKARQFAAMYSDKEVDALCELVNRSDQGRITKSHVIRLLAVPSKRRRDELAKLIVREQWTVQRLGPEITKEGKSSQGGRRPKRPATVDEALGQIQRMVQQWERWVEMIEDKDDTKGVSIGDLPVQVARAVAGMSKSAQAAAMETRSSSKYAANERTIRRSVSE
ncbi:hypothetical protein Psta_3404 [Pirellula staleyi DSM 6068]|uniref:Uncharacterized protein n=1 Tax=Pirellula staleyi (strain ATCC 27377 / DSM 6068 / ICPB 4128) TaxID=530564 RepID=D2QXZ1_PIRSD|nr:hypothetical protein [Pirellula staleyi]ADB18068.1 hypothetical protein Psta_3404 [Pirellula staleyi DSM 6068]